MEFNQYPKNWQIENQLTNDADKKIQKFKYYNLKEEKKHLDFHQKLQNKSKLARVGTAVKPIRKTPYYSRSTPSRRGGNNSNDEELKLKLINDKTSSDTSIIKSFRAYNKPILNNLQKKLLYIKRKNDSITGTETPANYLQITDKKELQLDRNAQTAIDNFQKYIDDGGSEENLFNIQLLKEFHTSIGPAWYQELSDRQMNLANGLYNDLLNDLKQNTTFRCSRFLQQIGMASPPIPNGRNIKRILELSRGNDLAFLWFAYDLFYRGRHNNNNINNVIANGEYSFNERLILSTICHLDMITTLRELDRILPKAVEREKPRPTIEKRQCYCKYFSPYLEPITRPKIPGQTKQIRRSSPIIPNPKFIPYEIYKDGNFIVLNESNRWYARKNWMINKSIHEIVSTTTATTMATNDNNNNNQNDPNVKEPIIDPIKDSRGENENRITKKQQNKGLFNRFKQNFCCIPPCSNEDDDDDEYNDDFNADFRTVPSIDEMEKTERKQIIKSLCKELLFNNNKKRSSYGQLLKNLLILLRDNTRCSSDHCAGDTCTELLNQRDDDDDHLTRTNQKRFIHLIELTNTETIDEFKYLAKKYVIQIILKYVIRELVKNSSDIQNIQVCKSCTDCIDEYTFYQEIIQQNSSMDGDDDDDQPTSEYEIQIYNEIIRRNGSNLAIDLDKKLELKQWKIECCTFGVDDNNHNDDEDHDDTDDDDDASGKLSICMKNLWQLEINLWTNKIQKLPLKKGAAVNNPSHGIKKIPDDDTIDLLINQKLIKAINVMRKNPKFVLCTLPDIHKLPILREWIKLRYNCKYTADDRNRSILKTKKLWTLKREDPVLEIVKRQIPKAKDCCHKSILDYDYKECLMNQINQIYGKYERHLKLELIEQNRMFWPTMKPYLCTMGPPRNTFYAYLPAKENEICIFRPWQRHEYNHKMVKRN